jgi:hypothetical protein
MKVEFKTLDELQAFIRGTMLAKMHASVEAMQRGGCSEQSIEALVADTMQKIAEACDEASQMVNAATDEFNAPITIN